MPKTSTSTKWLRLKCVIRDQNGITQHGAYCWINPERIESVTEICDGPRKEISGFEIRTHSGWAVEVHERPEIALIARWLKRPFELEG